MARPIEERIIEMRAEVEAHIEKLIAQLAKETPGVPAVVLHQMFMARSNGCMCLAVLHNAKVPA